MGKHLANVQLLSVEMNHGNYPKIVAAYVKNNKRRYVVS